MKTLILLVLGLLAVGCLTPEQKQKALRDSVVGEYEGKNKNENTSVKLVLLENGISATYIDGDKKEHKWKIAGKEIHIVYD